MLSSPLLYAVESLSGATRRALETALGPAMFWAADDLGSVKLQVESEQTGSRFFMLVTFRWARMRWTLDSHVFVENEAEAAGLATPHAAQVHRCVHVVSRRVWSASYCDQRRVEVEVTGPPTAINIRYEDPDSGELERSWTILSWASSTAYQLDVYEPQWQRTMQVDVDYNELGQVTLYQGLSSNLPQEFRGPLPPQDGTECIYAFSRPERSATRCITRDQLGRASRVSVNVWNPELGAFDELLVEFAYD
jgi:hypothetical protein